MFDFFTLAFLSYFLEFFSFFPLYFRVIAFLKSPIKTKPLIQLFHHPLYIRDWKHAISGIYITKIKHWIEISRFSKLKSRGNKFRGWQKILIFARIKFRDLAKKITKPQIFLPAKISDNKVINKYYALQTVDRKR